MAVVADSATVWVRLDHNRNMGWNLDDALDRLHVVRVPMSVRFRGVQEREVALFRGQTPTAWQEWSPFLEYGPEEASRWLAASIAAEDEAPPLRRDSVPVNATLPAVPVERVHDVLARFGSWRTVKIKVAERGQTLRDDLARVRAVRDAHPEARIRIDANAGWDLEQAERALRELAVFDLEYAEQPVASVEDLARLRGRVEGIKIAADESIRKASDPLRVAELDAADVIVVKVQPLGGAARALDIIRDTGLPAVVSSALETSVGLAEGVRLAAALDDLPYDCGLATGALLTTDVTRARMLPAWDGEAAVLPAVRPAVDEHLVSELAASEDRIEHWRERLRQAWPHLPGELRAD